MILLDHYSSLLTVASDIFALAQSLGAAGGHGHASASSLLDVVAGINSQPVPTVTLGLDGTGTVTATGTLSGTVQTVDGKAVAPALTKDKMIRGLTLGAVAFIIGVIVGRPIINWLRDRGIGKHIRIEGPASHQIKTGTPTMGGIIFLIPLVIVIAVFMDILTNIRPRAKRIALFTRTMSDAYDKIWARYQKMSPPTGTS